MLESERQRRSLGITNFSDGNWDTYYSVSSGRLAPVSAAQSGFSKNMGPSQKDRKGRQEMNQMLMKRISSVQKDFIASHLRLQLTTLQQLLSAVEASDKIEQQYTLESLRRVESNVRNLRNFLGDW